MNLKLLNNKVLVRNKEKENKTDSGFILPENNNEEKIKTAEVVAVGNGGRNEDGERVPIDVKEGDQILYEYSSYGTKEIELNKEKLFLINESDIIGIIN